MSKKAPNAQRKTLTDIQKAWRTTGQDLFQNGKRSDSLELKHKEIRNDSRHFHSILHPGSKATPAPEFKPTDKMKCTSPVDNKKGKCKSPFTAVIEIKYCT